MVHGGIFTNCLFQVNSPDLELGSAFRRKGVSFPLSVLFIFALRGVTGVRDVSVCS